VSSIHFERDYPHPIERVWEAIATAQGISAWLMPTDFEPRLGKRFELRWKKMPGWRGFVECEVIELDPPRTLAFTWIGNEGQKPTVVRFQLTSISGGTRLVFEHSGFEGLGGFFDKLMMKNGWRKKILRVQLTAALEVLAKQGAAGLTPLKP